MTPPWERPATTDARARGLATHAVLQRLDLAAPLADAGQVASQVASLQAQGLLEPHQPSLVDADAIAAFFATDLGRLMRERRDRVRREWAFSLGVGVDEILGAAGKRGDSHLPESREVSSSTELPQAQGFPSPGLGREDVVLVQGIIDVLLELDDGTLMVLDFKTDAVRTDEQVARRVQAYGGQIRWYGRAAEAILGRPVSRRLIYFLTPQRLAEVPAAPG